MSVWMFLLFLAAYVWVGGFLGLWLYRHMEDGSDPEHPEDWAMVAMSGLFWPVIVLFGSFVLAARCHQNRRKEDHESS